MTQSDLKDQEHRRSKDATKAAREAHEKREREDLAGYPDEHNGERDQGHRKPKPKPNPEA